VFGSCGFLSFSSVLCRFGGRFEASLYIHFIRRWVEARRHSSAPRESENKKKGEKVRHSSQCRVRGWRGGVVEGGLAEVLRGAERRRADG
jgi:hypothetical protein